MTNVLYPPSRPQSVGEILDLAFRIFGATLLKCLPFSFAAVIIGQLPNLQYLLSRRAALLMQPEAQLRRYYEPLWWVLEIVAICGTLFLYGAVILRAYSIVTAHAASGSEVLTGSLQKLPGMVLISILVLLAMAACLSPAVLFLASPGLIGKAMAVLAGLVLLIPAGVLGLRWSCAGTVYLLTDRGAVASMSHSWQLTAGSFWRLSLIYTVGVIVILVLSGLTGMISGVMSITFAHGDLAVVMAAMTAVTVLVGAISTPFYVGLALAVLGDLAVRKEGGDLAQRISAPATQ